MINVSIHFDKSTRCFDSTSAYVSFPYNAEIIAIIKKQEERFYFPASKKWEVSLTCIDNVIKELSSFINIEMHFSRSKALKDDSERVKHVDMNELEFKTKPMDYQLEGIAFGLEHQNFILADQQGLGKTLQAINIAEIRQKHGLIKRCLVICGVNGLKWNWQEEIKKHGTQDSIVLGDKGKINISNENKIQDLKAILKGDCDAFFFITNIESFRNEDIIKLTQKICKEQETMIIFDECHKAKNPTSQQGKGVARVIGKYHIAMTGTPVINNPFDVYTCLSWLGFEKHSWWQFRQHYGVFGGYGGKELIGFRHLDQLQKNLESVMLRRLKEDVLDLPEKVYIDEYLQLCPTQTSVYKEVLTQVKKNIDKIKLSANPLAELIRLRQATGDTSLLSSDINKSAKLDRMEELLEEILSYSGEKVIIYSNWVAMLESAKKRLRNKYVFAEVHGEVKDKEKEIKKFKEQENCKILLGTIGAMGTGYTLTEASNIIFLDEAWNRATMEQAEDRAHRIGTTKSVVIYTLICKYTIDERIHELIKIKGELSDILVDNKKPDTINFLLS